MGRFAKSEYVTWKKMQGGKSVLFDLKSGRYYTLNETASMIWENLASRVPADEIVKLMEKAFAGQPAECEAGVRDMVALLTEKGFIAEAQGEQAGKAGSAPQAGVPYQKPEMQEHEAVQEITAGSGSSCGSSHYWYPN